MDDKQEKLIVEVNFPKARKWADIVSLTFDIDSAIRICERLIRELEINKNDRVIIESLWTTALIKYARCFSSGKRFGLTIELFNGLKGDPVGTHNYYIEMRNKHLAHSVNPFEQVKIALILADPKLERKINGTVSFSQWHISAKRDGVETLKNLCLVLRQKLSEKGRNLHQKVLEEAAKINIDELYSKAELKTVVPGPKDTSKPRKN